MNFSSWGNLLNNALSKAVEKAMESDVEYRRGLPFNLSSFMGSGVVGRLFVQVLKITNYLSFYHFYSTTVGVANPKIKKVSSNVFSNKHPLSDFHLDLIFHYYGWSIR